MSQKTNALPLWILIVSFIFAALGITVSATLYFSPESALPNIDLTAIGVQYLIYMWAARQFAEGFIFGFAAFKKSIPMLTLSYIFFLVMNIWDAIIGITIKDNGLAIGAIVMCVIASTMIFLLNRHSVKA